MLAYLQKNTNSTQQIWYFQKLSLPLQAQFTLCMSLSLRSLMSLKTLKTLQTLETLETLETLKSLLILSKQQY